MEAGGSNVLREQIELEDTRWKEKRGGDDLDCQDHRPRKEAGTEVFTGCRSQKSLNPMKQFGKKIGNEKCIAEDQCPKGDSLKTDFDSSTLFRFLNPKKSLANHVPLQRQFCMKMKQICKITEVLC